MIHSVIKVARPLMAVAAAAALVGCSGGSGSGDAPNDTNSSAGAGQDSSGGESDSTKIGSAVAAGLNPATTSSQRYCDALRSVVNDATFGQPLVDTEVVDYEPGRSSTSYLVLCELATDSVQTSSHSSGGGSFQPGLAELAITAGPFEQDGVPASQPASEWVDYNPGTCKGEDGSFFGTAATTVFCLDHTAHGFTRVYFSEGILVLDMQAPQLMTTAFTYEKYLSARDAIFKALAQS